jgi:hypothetical protein
VQQPLHTWGTKGGTPLDLYPNGAVPARNTSPPRCRASARLRCSPGRRGSVTTVPLLRLSGLRSVRYHRTAPTETIGVGRTVRRAAPPSLRCAALGLAGRTGPTTRGTGLLTKRAACGTTVQIAIWTPTGWVDRGRLRGPGERPTVRAYARHRRRLLRLLCTPVPGVCGAFAPLTPPRCSAWCRSRPALRPYALLPCVARGRCAHIAAPPALLTAPRLEPQIRPRRRTHACARLSAFGAAPFSCETQQQGLLRRRTALPLIETPVTTSVPLHERLVRQRMRSLLLRCSNTRRRLAGGG